MTRSPYLALLFVPLLLGGCVYGRHRLHDAQDVFTLGGTVGIGVNVNAAIFMTGLGFNRTVVGLEDGGWVWGDGCEEAAFLVVAAKKAQAERLKWREKDYGPDLRFVFIPYSLEEPGRPPEVPEWRVTNLGKFEVAAAGIVGLRVGVNVIELVDFLLGWTTLDLVGDDKRELLERRPRGPGQPVGR